MERVLLLSTSLRFSAFSADNLGMWASALCVVHCIVTPVLLSLSSVFAHFIPGEEKTHRTLAVGVAALGGIVLIKGVGTHGRGRNLGLMVVGRGFIVAGALFGDLLASLGCVVAATMARSLL